MSIPFSLRDLVRKVYRDDTMPLHEKQRAWQTLLELLPDETVQTTDPVLHTVEARSLHELVRAYIAEQKRLERQFFADEPDTVYLADYRDRWSGETDRWSWPSLTWADVGDFLTDYLLSNDAPCRAEITKYYPKQPENGFMKELTAVFNENLELLEVTSRMMMTFPAFRDLVSAMEEV